MKNNDHWMQTMLTRRFQPFVEDWPDNLEVTEYDLTAIQSMPISLFVAQADELCTAARADWLAERLSTLQNHYEFSGIGHDYFTYGTDGNYRDLLFAEVGAELLDEPAAKQVVSVSRTDSGSGSDSGQGEGSEGGSGSGSA